MKILKIHPEHPPLSTLPNHRSKRRLCRRWTRSTERKLKQKRSCCHRDGRSEKKASRRGMLISVKYPTVSSSPSTPTASVSATRRWSVCDLNRHPPLKLTPACAPTIKRSAPLGPALGKGEHQPYLLLFAEPTCNL